MNTDEIGAKLFEKYAETRDVETRNELYENYSFIALIVAKKFSGKGVDYDDLVQVCSVALLRAIERFDPSRGLKFQTFATPSLIGEVKNYFRDKSRTIRLPRKDSEQLSRLMLIRSELEQQLGRAPEPGEIAKAMGITPERVLELMEAYTASSPLPIDKLGNDDDSPDFSSLIGQEDAQFSRIEEHDLLRRCMAKLDEKERFIVIERYIKGKTQREIAEKLGVSQMYVSRSEKKILDKMRKLAVEAV